MASNVIVRPNRKRSRATSVLNEKTRVATRAAQAREARAAHEEIRSEGSTPGDPSDEEGDRVTTTTVATADVEEEPNVARRSEGGPAPSSTTVPPSLAPGAYRVGTDTATAASVQSSRINISTPSLAPGAYQVGTDNATANESSRINISTVVAYIPEEPPLVPATRVETKCGIDFRNRRDRIIFLVALVALVGLVVSLSVAFSGKGGETSPSSSASSTIGGTTGPKVESTTLPTLKPSSFHPATTKPSATALRTPSPTPHPTNSSIPTPLPTTSPKHNSTTIPAMPTTNPTTSPTSSLMRKPTESPVPTPIPTAFPTHMPTTDPTASPTSLPTRHPTKSPIPTHAPTDFPTHTPTTNPTASPTISPTRHPTKSPFPTGVPTSHPTSSPTSVPTKMAWVQVGNDIDGDGTNPKISLSESGSRLAIGISERKSEPGLVRVFLLEGGKGGDWIQLGDDILGDSAEDRFGYSVAISGNGKRLAVGAIHHNNGMGQVKVYQFGSGKWNLLGSPLLGEAEGDDFGFSVSLSLDGTIVAVGAGYNDNINGNDSGHIRIFQYASGSWTQLGDDIDGEAEGDLSGLSVSLSSNGLTVAIGAIRNDGENGSNSGHVRVYTYEGRWKQVGQDIDGEAADDYSGRSVSLSENGNILAVGADWNDGINGQNSGHVRVYEYDQGDEKWSQRGSDIDGEAADDWSGISVSLSSDGSVVAVGARFNHGNGERSGHVRIHKFDGNDWIQIGAEIDGKSANDQFGYAVSLSGDGNRVAIGNGQWLAGEVGVFDRPPV